MVLLERVCHAGHVTVDEFGEDGGTSARVGFGTRLRGPNMASPDQEEPDVVNEQTIEQAKAFDELIDACQGIVRLLAWKIFQKLPRWVELEDLIGYGQVGLALAARDFDKSRGNQFSTYAYYRVRGAILDGLKQMSWFSRYEYEASRYRPSA